MFDRIKNFSKFFLGIPLTIISFYFIFSFIYSNKSEIIPRFAEMNLLPFIIGIIFIIIFFLLRSLAWKSIIVREGHNVETIKAIYLLEAAEIKRYIPGSILGFISRINNFGTFGIHSKTIIKMIVYESVIFLFASIVVSVPGVFYIFERGRELPPIYYLAGICLVFVILASGAALGFRFIKKYSTNTSLLLSKIPEFKYAFLLMFFAWIFFGVGNYLIAVSFFYLDPTRFLELSSFFVLSWLIGYIVIVVPLGLGVREAAVVYGLSTQISAGFAAVIAILLRVGLVAAELIFLAIVYAFYKYGLPKIKISLEKTILWLSIVSYMLYFSYYSMQKHLNFFTGKFDLGNMDQTVWNTFHGNVFQLTNPNGTETVSRLAFHADFILILLTPFYLIWNDPRTLLIIQTIILALGAYFVYKIAEVVLPKIKYLPLFFALSYLLNPYVQKQNLFDFHAVTLATTFLLAAFYFIIIEKYRNFLIFLLLAFLTKENVYLLGFIFGGYLTIKAKNKRWLVLSTVSLLIFYLLVSKLIPGARGSSHFALEFFSDFGDSANEVLKNVFFNPPLVFSKIMSSESLNYITTLLAPVGFLALLAPIILLFIIPDLGINLLSSNANFRDITFHYSAVIIPFIYIASIYGAKNLIKLKIPYVNSVFISFIIIFSSLHSTYQYGVLPGAKNPSLEIYSRYLPERAEIKSFLEGIPSDLSVAATNNIGAHVSHREDIYTIPVGTNDADVVVLLLGDVFASPTIAAQKQIAYELQNNPEYIELYKLGDFIAFAKKNIAHKIMSGY